MSYGMPFIQYCRVLPPQKYFYLSVSMLITQISVYIRKPVWLTYVKMQSNWGIILAIIKQLLCYCSYLSSDLTDWLNYLVCAHICISGVDFALFTTGLVTILLKIGTHIHLFQVAKLLLIGGWKDYFNLY